MGGNELKHVSNAFETNWIAPIGPHISNFEKELSHRSNGFEVVALSSGTSSLHLALILLGVKKEDNVLCSSFTFSSKAYLIKQQHLAFLKHMPFLERIVRNYLYILY